MRCPKIKGEGGDVGPDLAGISAKHDRAYILQSITEPDAVIAPGFDNVLGRSRTARWSPACSTPRTPAK